MADALITGWIVPLGYVEGARWRQRAAKSNSNVATAILEDLGETPDVSRSRRTYTVWREHG